LALTQGKNFWVIAVYTPMPSSGDASTDLKSGWKRIVLAGPDYQGFPLLPYYDVAHTVGYPGKRADASSINRTGYTRLYVLEAIRTNLTVADISGDWQSGVANSISLQQFDRSLSEQFEQLRRCRIPHRCQWRVHLQDERREATQHL
jgi:hypothetical protein